jgi:hypothetical protein
MVSKRHENQKETPSCRKAFFAYPESSDFNSLLDTGSSLADDIAHSKNKILESFFHLEQAQAETTNHRLHHFDLNLYVHLWPLITLFTQACKNVM